MHGTTIVQDGGGDGFGHGPEHGQADSAAHCTELGFEQVGAAMAAKLDARDSGRLPPIPSTGSRIVTLTVTPTVRLTVEQAVGGSIGPRFDQTMPRRPGVIVAVAIPRRRCPMVPAPGS